MSDGIWGQNLFSGCLAVLVRRMGLDRIWDRCLEGGNRHFRLKFTYLRRRDRISLGVCTSEICFVSCSINEMIGLLHI